MSCLFSRAKIQWKFCNAFSEREKENSSWSLLLRKGNSFCFPFPAPRLLRIIRMTTAGMLALWAQHFVPNFSPFISKLLCQSGSAASANWGKILRPFVELSGQQVFLCYALHSHFLTRNYSQWESDYRMKGEGSWKIEKKTFQKTTLNFFEIYLSK